MDDGQGKHTFLFAGGVGCPAHGFGGAVLGVAASAKGCGLALLAEWFVQEDGAGGGTIWPGGYCGVAVEVLNAVDFLLGGVGVDGRKGKGNAAGQT